MSEENMLSNFLREMRADQKTKSFDEMAQRLIAEREIRRFLSTLKDEGFIVQENFDDSIMFDFLLRKYEKEVLILLKYEKNRFILSKQEITIFHDTLRLNSLSEGIIVVWTLREAFSSVYLSALKLNKLLSKDVNTFSFSAEIQPLKKCIFDTFSKPESLVSELKFKEKTKVLEADRLMLSSTFKENLLKSFQDLKKRRYRLSYKKKAIESFTFQDLQLLENVFEIALGRKFEEERLVKCINDISRVEEE